ncbi:hypothetical protein NKH18_16870 [Streptomyces sp. M10(2022)]
MGNVFWSHQFGFTQGSGAYTGMQSNGGQQRTFLFSLWDATEARAGSEGSYCLDFGGEEWARAAGCATTGRKATPTASGWPTRETGGSASPSPTRPVADRSSWAASEPAPTVCRPTEWSTGPSTSSGATRRCPATTSLTPRPVSGFRPVTAPPLPPVSPAPAAARAVSP